MLIYRVCKKLGQPKRHGKFLILFLSNLPTSKSSLDKNSRKTQEVQGYFYLTTIIEPLCIVSVLHFEIWIMDYKPSLIKLFV